MARTPLLRSLVRRARELVEQTPALASATTAAARERGLILLSSGLYGNVLRILIPLVATDEDVAQGLAVLEESLGDANAAAR